MMKNKEKKVFEKKKLKSVIFVIILAAIVLFILLYNNAFNSMKTYTIVNGTVEKTSDTYAYVLKKEKVIDIDENSVAIPVVDQDQRACKDEVVAVYKNSGYKDYESEISSLDKEIQSMIKDLPAVYSNDVSNIDTQITELTKSAKKETSYVKMQEYKNKVNDLLEKKINILGELSPNGSKIRELIAKRNELKNSNKSSRK